MKSKDKLVSFFLYVALLIVSFIFLFPCLWIILASFSKSGTIYSFKGFFPQSFSFHSFKVLLTDTGLYNYPRWFLNSLIISTCSCVLGTLLVILTAYAMSRFNFKGKKA
ncbi:hypothetical protein V4S31_07490 [Enterococcus cecorum]|uniref:hypothetical protein n=1 Tax=Enterococcus cecorum TaxID=44008 RepID=UPI00326466C2